MSAMSNQNPPIKVGDEVILRNLPDRPVGVVTYNTSDQFCVINKHGVTRNTTRAEANPLKTGKHYDVESFLMMLRI